MTILLYITSLSVFMWFFYAIWAWYIGVIPLLIALYIIIMSSKDYRKHAEIESTQRQTYSIYIAWLAILAGFVGVAQFFSDNTVQIWLRVMGINIIGWIWSYMLSYNDGKQMAQTWYYAAILYILRQASYSTDRVGLRDIIGMLWVLTLGIVWFIVWVIGHRRSIESYMWYVIFVLTGWSIMIAIGNYFTDTYAILLIDSFLVLGLSVWLYYSMQYHIPSSHEIKKVSVRRILAGERITKNKQIPQQSKFLEQLYYFVAGMPLWTRYGIEAINCALVVITIILYLSNIANTASQRHQVVYRSIIGLFVGTALILKRIGFTSIMQKVTLFAVINYAIYLTLYTIFDGAMGAITRWAIVRNILSSIVIFYGPSSFLADILEKQDYIYWIVMTVAGLCINIYLLWLTSLAGQLIFSIVFIYCGVQWLLLYYGIRHIQQLE